METLGIGGGIGLAFFGLFSGLGLYSYLKAKAVVMLTQAGYTPEDGITI